MKRGKIGKKNESIFYHDVFTVVKRKFPITVEKSNGQLYTRNISFFKVVQENCRKQTTEEKTNPTKKYEERKRIHYDQESKMHRLNFILYIDNEWT